MLHHYAHHTDVLMPALLTEALLQVTDFSLNEREFLKSKPTFFNFAVFSLRMHLRAQEHQALQEGSIQQEWTL